MNAPPTDKQRSILRFITTFIRRNGYPPSIVEIGREFGIRSTNGVNDHLRALERKGLLRRAPVIARGLAVTKRGLLELLPSEAA